MPQKLLIVHHSPSDNTRWMADAVIRGARSPEIAEVVVQAVDALSARPDDLLDADGLLLGTPENFGYMSGGLKVFFDRVYYPCLDKVDGLPYAMFVRAGNDGSGALASVRRIASGLKLREVQEPALMAGAFEADCLERCRELGMTMAAGLEAGIF